MSDDLEELEAEELIDLIRAALRFVPSTRVRDGALAALDELEQRIEVDDDDHDDDDDAGEDDAGEDDEGRPW